MLGTMRLAFTAVLLLLGTEPALVHAQEAHHGICIDICVSTITVGFVSQPRMNMFWSSVKNRVSFIYDLGLNHMTNCMFDYESDSEYAPN